MYVAKNILSKSDINDLYQRMLNEPFWRIGATYQGIDDPASHHPRSVVMNSNGIYSPFIAGYFTAVVNRVRDKIHDDYGFVIPTNSLDTIGFNAEKKGNISIFHTDAYNGETFTWSIVGFLTPQWDPSWGGELQIEDRTYTFEPGDFVLFKSNEYHDSLPIKVDTPFWRISVACLIK
tara:strand:- start:381 stop:911 length:531 start_codon:yes stop_codon:yes gene_type:complete